VSETLLGLNNGNRIYIIYMYYIIVVTPHFCSEGAKLRKMYRVHQLWRYTIVLKLA